jgi:hypothetical protein
VTAQCHTARRRRRAHDVTPRVQRAQLHCSFRVVFAGNTGRRARGSPPDSTAQPSAHASVTRHSTHIFTPPLFAIFFSSMDGFWSYLHQSRGPRKREWGASLTPQHTTHQKLQPVSSECSAGHTAHDHRHHD